MECVEIMDRIARRIEQGKTVATYVNPVVPYSARTHLNATAVLSRQRDGGSRHLRLHPLRQKPRATSRGCGRKNAPIYAFTPNLDVCRSLSLHFGVRAPTPSSFTTTRTKISCACRPGCWSAVTCNRATRSSWSRISWWKKENLATPSTFIRLNLRRERLQPSIGPYHRSFCRPGRGICRATG